MIADGAAEPENLPVAGGRIPFAARRRHRAWQSNPPRPPRAASCSPGVAGISGEQRRGVRRGKRLERFLQRLLLPILQRLDAALDSFRRDRQRRTCRGNNFRAPLARAAGSTIGAARISVSDQTYFFAASSAVTIGPPRFQPLWMFRLISRPSRSASRRRAGKVRARRE